MMASQKTNIRRDICLAVVAGFILSVGFMAMVLKAVSIIYHSINAPNV